MGGLTNVLLILVAVGSTKANVARWPQPAGARSCSVAGFSLDVGDVIKPVEGSYACTAITCEEDRMRGVTKLFGVMETCRSKSINGSRLSRREKERIREENEDNQRKPYPKCCPTAIVNDDSGEYDE